MDQLIFASLSHTHYWYEVGMLKVPAEIGITPTGKQQHQSRDLMPEQARRVIWGSDPRAEKGVLITGSCYFLLLLLLLAFSVFAEKHLHTVANPTRGLLNKKREQKVWRRPPPPPPSAPNIQRSARTRNIETQQMARTASKDASTCVDATQVSVYFATMKGSFGSSSRSIGVASQVLRLRVRYKLFKPGCLSLSCRCLAASTSYFLNAATDLFLPSVIVSTYTSASRRGRFPIPRYAKRRDAALYAINSEENGYNAREPAKSL